MKEVEKEIIEFEKRTNNPDSKKNIQITDTEEYNLGKQILKIQNIPDLVILLEDIRKEKEAEKLVN